MSPKGILLFVLLFLAKGKQTTAEGLAVVIASYGVYCAVVLLAFLLAFRVLVGVLRDYITPFGRVKGFFGLSD